MIVSFFIGDKKEHMSMMKKVFQQSTQQANMSTFGTDMSADAFFDAIEGGSSTKDDDLLTT